MPLTMKVYAKNSDISVTDVIPTLHEKEVQTETIKSLPCSVCTRNDVNVHLAVAAGVIDFE